MQVTEWIGQSVRTTYKIARTQHRHQEYAGNANAERTVEMSASGHRPKTFLLENPLALLRANERVRRWSFADHGRRGWRVVGRNGF